jgi:uncharacterized protein (UPF0332 family)
LPKKSWQRLIYCLKTIDKSTAKPIKGVIQLFGQYFVKTGELSIDQSRALGDAYDLRRLSDYDETFTLTHSQTEAVVRSARSFLQKTEALLQGQ